MMSKFSGILHLLFFLFVICFTQSFAHEPIKVTVGMEVLLTEKYKVLLSGKRIGLITNHTAVDSKMRSSIDLLKLHAPTYGYTLSALFGPEHGITGEDHAEEKIELKQLGGIPIYSLHGATRRPTEKMLKGIDLLIFDIQDIGSRSYTYISTLFYAMEEAAKHHIPFIVTDRPNPINGVTVDGPMLEEKWRSFVGYVNVPYCHGMTVGELARFFNEEYKVGCDLQVIPMKGWNRQMTFNDTALPWVPTSPYIPEASTVFYYPMTGVLGELQIANIGIGYTLPFKLVGAPWIHAKNFADKLNAQNLPGVHFHPFHYKPFYGKCAKKNCQGVLITVTDPLQYLPVTTQYVIMGILKSLYPSKFKEAMQESSHRREMFAKVNGTDRIYQIFQEKQFVVWELREFDKQQREAFLLKRKKYLIKNYSNP